MKHNSILTLLLFLCGSAVSQRPVLNPSAILYPVSRDVSPPLRDMPVILNNPDSLKVEREIPNQNMSLLYERTWSPSEARSGHDPVLQQDAGFLPPNATRVNIEGIENSMNVNPPDPVGDVGLNHYIESVNLKFAIYSKTGSLLYGPATLSTLWQGFPGVYTSDGDPIVMYDPLADRWVISQFSLPSYPSGPFYELIAVSQTADPLGAWYRYAFQFGDMPDYPKLGVWPDGYYMSANMYKATTMSWLGPAVMVLERDSILQGKAARITFFQRASDMNASIPADLDGPAPPVGLPGCFLSSSEDIAGGGDRLDLYKLKADWANPSNSTFSGPQSMSVASFDGSMCNGNRSCIPQAGTSRKLDALAGFLLNRLQYRNFGAYQTMVSNMTVDVDGTDHAGVRWYELRSHDTVWSVFQQGTFAPDTNNRWMGSIAMDGAGNIGLAYSVSGTGMYPSILATGRRAADPPGIMTFIEEPVMAGSGAQSDPTSRWGDYSCLTVDPVDDQTFWYCNEYYASSSYQNWKTRIASFTIDDLAVSVPERINDGRSPAFNLRIVPNPASKSAVISWKLPSRSTAVLGVYNLMGKEMQVLVNQVMEDGDKHIAFNVTGLPDGVYICRIEANQRNESVKMVICR